MMEKSNKDSFAEILHWRIELGRVFLAAEQVADVIVHKLDIDFEITHPFDVLN